MATIPTVPTEVPGNFNTAALWNANVLGGLNYLLNPVLFKAYATVSQAISSGVSSIPVTLDTEEFDTDGGHSTTTNTSRYTCQTAGIYMAFGSATFAQNSTGTRAAEILKNGNPNPGGIQQIGPSAGNGTTASTFTYLRLAVGDYAELGIWQNSGTGLSTQVSSAHLYPIFMLMRVSN